MAPKTCTSDNTPHRAEHDQMPAPGIGGLDMAALRVQVLWLDCSIRQIDPAPQALCFCNKMRMDFARNRQIATKLAKRFVDWRQ